VSLTFRGRFAAPVQANLGLAQPNSGLAQPNLGCVQANLGSARMWSDLALKYFCRKPKMRQGRSDPIAFEQPPGVNYFQYFLADCNKNTTWLLYSWPKRVKMKFQNY
jgi:hypothetical protein